ncbi:hypothetical protein QTO34_016641 [Cnephaeus nilssonii]|uniref:Uncharacterized protein n=1 Tax=Cnephaeus nilssonii TaxID=3371016 RepID=A0AA40I2P4_CNENI|nr:hypothetical protein QTO34_016641 [Eptesicus nilssonii]
MNITRSDALSHRKQQDPILENMAQQISLGRSCMFINTFLSSTPVSPAIKNHKKEKSKKGPLRKKSNITRGWEQGEGKQDKGERLSTNSCNKWSTFKNILESIWQNEKKKQDNEILSKAGLPLLSSVEHRKDQNIFIAEQEAQQQTLRSENTSETVCSPQMIPFQTEKLQKTMPPQKDTRHRIGEKILGPKSEKARFDYLLADGTEYSITSGGSPTEKLDIHRSGFLHSKGEKKDIEAQKVIKHRVDQNIPPTKSGNSMLGDPCDESSRRKVGGHIAKKYEDLQRDLLTRSTPSVLSESKRQKEVFKFPEEKNVTGPITVTMKAQKPPCSQTLTVTEHGTLYCRKEQECDSKSTIKDMQQNKSLDNTFSSLTPFSTDSKIDTEMYRTLKAESDQQRVRFKNSVYLKLEKSTCYWEAQKANPTDTQNNRSGYTMEMNVQQNKEEVGVEMINSMFSKHQEKKTQASKKAHTKSLEGYMLKEDRLRSDIEDKVLPMYMDRKAKKLQLCTYSCNKWTTSKSILESKWQNKRIKQDNDILSKAGLPFLNSMGCRKDQNVLIAKREAQQQLLVSESVSKSVSSPLMIPFQNEKLQKTMPPLKYILQRIGEIISCPKSGKVRFDYLLADGIGYSTSSGGSPTRKVDVHRTGSLHSKREKKDIKAQKVVKHTVDQNIPPTKSGNSVLGDPCDESSRRKVGGHIAKKYEDLQRDLLTRSTTSVLSESKRQKEVFKFPEEKNVTGPITVTMKAQKPPCSQTLTVTEHGTLYCRKEQECNSKSTIKDMQQNKSLDNAFSSPTPFSTDSKIDMEMCRTLKAESDQQRVRFKNSVYLKLEKSTCYWEAQKANPTDTQNNRSGYTMEMNVQQNKEEVGVETINSMFSKHQEKKTQGSKDEPGESSDSEEVVYVEPIIPDILISPQEGKQCVPQNKEEAGVETINLMFPIHEEKKTQESKECGFNKPKEIALWDEDDSGVLIRSLFYFWDESISD